MSVLQSLQYGWVISHQNFVKNIYKNVVSEDSTYNLQLKDALFNIQCPYVRNNENKLKDGKHNLKRKRKKMSSNSNFKELKKEVEYIEKIYKLFSEEVQLSSLFNTNKNYSVGSGTDNKEAQNEADNCYSELEKYSFINSHGSNGDQPLLKTINGGSFLFPKTCRFFCKNITEMKDVIIDEKFDLILLDPPWWNKYIRRKNAKSNQGYQMMYNLDLGVIPIDRILSPNGIVVVWCTNSPQHLRDLQEEIFPKWGIRFVAKWYWLKVTVKGEPICSFSEPPGKQPFEQIIFGVRRTNLNNCIPHRKLVISIPSALHSHKPPLAELLSSYMGENPRCLEVFARYLLPEWTSWGLEVVKLQHDCLYEPQT